MLRIVNLAIASFLLANASTVFSAEENPTAARSQGVQITELPDARDSEAVIGILKLWRDAGASRAARDFYVVAP